MSSNFYVSLAEADNIGRFSDLSEKNFGRVSLTNLFPSNVKENLLFSMSFKSDIHYDSMKGNLDPLALTEGLHEHRKILPRRIFADCGAYQFRNFDKPTLPDGSDSNAQNAWIAYQKKHLEKNYPWEEILLCAPDHIICKIKDPYTDKQLAEMKHMSKEEKKAYKKKNPLKERQLKSKEFNSRVKFNQKQATSFFKLTKGDTRVTPVAVIHGHCDFNRDIKERKKRLLELVKVGYKYVALGGMVPYSGNKKKALEIIAGIKDLDNPIIAKDSILGHCKNKGIKLHVFGLTSPDWYRWLFRLGVDSFDGSKLATEGAVNGIYWVLKDGKGTGREPPSKPKKVTELYNKINIKNIKFETWKWQENEKEILIPEIPTHYEGIDLSCDCPACTYLKSARCPSKRCWLRKKEPSMRHSCEPLMRGSNEHNMGRAAHNAHVYGKLIEKIKYYNKIANKSNLNRKNEWLKNWTTIEVEE